MPIGATRETSLAMMVTRCIQGFICKKRDTIVTEFPTARGFRVVCSGLRVTAFLLAFALPRAGRVRDTGLGLGCFGAFLVLIIPAALAPPGRFLLSEEVDPETRHLGAPCLLLVSVDILK